MFYTRGLLLKGILGFGAASAAAYGGLTQKERIAGWFSGGDEATKPAAALTEATSKLLDEVGLECQNLETATADNGVVCSKKTGDGAKNIRVKREGSAEFNVSTLSSDSGGAKIKLYKLGEDSKTNGGYHKGLKLVIEEGNISGGDNTNKLEEFETYEIKEETNSSKPETKTYYLNRKTKASDKIKVLLGLDTCTFPEGANATQPCSLTTEQIKKIKFEGKDGEVTGTGTLQISIASASETHDFPYGFKFTLTPSSGGNISIPRGTGKEALTLNTSSPTVFKIKKSGTSLTLEEAITQDALTKKVGLSCTAATAEGVDCSKVESSNIKVKQESNTFDLTTALSPGKIKLYKDESTTDNYNKGLKFVIEDGDISGGGTNKLEQFETYEIKEDSSEWKLIRKKKSSEEKRRILGLPDDCIFPETGGQPQTCNITTANVNSINFEGKSNATLTAESGTATLKVEVVSSDDTDFPLGFKFTLTPGAGSTLTINKTGSAEAITIAGGKSKEFKIKQGAQNKKQLTLEEAWTHESLAKKVNLTCSGALSGTGGVDCTKTTSTDNIKAKKDSTEVNVSAISGGKIKVYKTSTGEDYNEGFKFVIEENDINGTSGNKLEQFETYEIKKETSGWKLVKKTDAKDGIKKALGLDSSCDFPTNGVEKECDISGDKFKKVNFEGGSDGRGTAPENIKLKISKPTGSSDYGPFGYKFVLDSGSEAKISNSVTIAGNTNTEFKIKRASGSNTITLEKALDVVTLGKKINLTCTTGNGEKKCTFGTSINVKDGSSSRKNATIQNGETGDKKLTYDDTADGHNQGIKFTASEEICLQNGGQSSESPTSISNTNATYEIKEDSGTWYLVKKSTSA